MDLKIINKGEFSILTVTPEQPVGSLLAVHGYGGCKEEMFGVILPLAGRGFYCVIPDLPGHGESGNIFNHKNALDCLEFCRDLNPSGYTTVIGHSIGARLALEYPLNAGKVAISPPLDISFPEGKKEMLRVLRPRRVREAAPFSGLREILEALGSSLPKYSGTRNLLLLAQNDLHAVRLSAQNAAKHIYDIVEIRYSNHSDIITSKDTAAEIWKWLSSKS